MRLPAFLLPVFLLLLLVTPAFAQTTYNVSGTVRGAENGEALIGATVAVAALNKAVVTNQNGYYALALPAGEHTIQVTYIGYEPSSIPVTLSSANRTINITLTASSSSLKEVVIEANSLEQKLNTTQMSMEKLTTQEAKLLPALFGEVDLIKTLQLKPGIQSGGEGSSGLYVRGGGPDQNLVLLDDAVVYNPSHLFGFFSVFNPDAVRSVELYKGGFPAQFGGRLSSVVEVKMNEGNKEEFGVTGGLGLISSRLTVEGPLVKGKSSFILSGRRTYVDVFTRQLNRLNEGKQDFSPIPDYYFYDLNGKVNYTLGEKDELSLTGYYGKDIFGFNDADFAFSFDWGNTMGALNWRHQFNPRFFASTTLSATGYKYNINNKIDIFSFGLSSNVNDVTLKTDFDLILDRGHSLKFGVLGTNHRFTVGRLNVDSDDNRLNFSAGNNYMANEFGAYIADDFQVNNKLSLNYGLRFSGFTNSGTTYTGLEPRASAKYNLTENLAIKGSYASMMQYIHLVTNSGASLPTDIWFPSTSKIKPQRSQQAAVGLSKLFNNGQFLLTNEVYYKWMHRQIDFRDGANLFVNDSLENEFLFGKGESYGNELYLEKIKGRTTGWIGYTLSWTNRTFPDINEGRTFPTRYDRRHDLSVVLIHKLSKRISLTGAFVYGSGNAFSLPESRYVFQDLGTRTPAVIPVYGDRNSFRLASYHRLDLGMVLKMKPKRGESDLTFNIYNAYDRRNPYFVYFDDIKDEETDMTLGFKARQVSLFPILPSITYNFKF